MKNRLLATAGWAGAVAIGAAGSAAAAPAAGAAPPEPAKPAAVEEVVVTGGSRLPTNLAAFPGSVTVLTSETIQEQRTITSDIEQLLSTTVPGFGAGNSGSQANLEQTMRGRKPAVFIDGVPIGEPNREAGRDVRTIDSSAVSRVEIIRGSSALYGNGGAGGIINYITAAPKDGPTRFSTEVGMGVSLVHPADSLRPNIVQTVSGRSGAVDFSGVASYESADKVFDADGDQISPSYEGPGGISDTRTVSLFGTVGFNWGEQRLAVTGLDFDESTGSAYHRVSGNPALGIKASAAPGPADPRQQKKGQVNQLINLVYSGLEVFGTSVRVQAYHQDDTQIFEWDPKFGGSQSEIISHKTGGRLDLSTPLDRLLPGARLLWGVDYLRDKASQPLLDGRIWIPQMDQHGLAEFAQLELPLGDRLTVQGGVRHETTDIDVPTFTTLVNTGPTFRGSTIQGGTLSFDATVYNAGASYRLADPLTVYYGFSQGFSLADIGLVLRAATNPTIISNPANSPQAQIIDNHEVGVRYKAPGLSASAALFQSTSELGSSYILVNGVLVVQRLPERVRGVEAQATYQLTDSVEVGGTFTYVVGKLNTNPTVDDSYDAYLTTQRIPPPLLNAFVQKEFANGWAVRVQGIHSGHEDRFPLTRNVFGQNEQKAYTTFDVSVTGKAGPGVLSIGVQNLFNASYFPLFAQLQKNQIAGQIYNYSKAQGAFATVRYRIEY